MRIGSTRLASLLTVALLAAAAVQCDKGGTPTQPTPCTFGVTPASHSFGSEGGTATIAVASAAGCDWSVTTNASWISVSGASTGTGSGQVTFSVAPNQSDASRNATIGISGTTVQVTQAGQAPCEYVVTSGKQTFDAAGGQGNATVSTGGACAWTASASDEWITISSGAQGRGNGTVTFSVARNAASTVRTGSIVVAGVRVVVEQAAAAVPPPPSPPPPVPVSCDYQVSPVEFQLHWHGAPGDGAQVSVAAPAGCVWTVTPGAGWITLLTPAEQSGTGTLRFSTSVHTDETTRSASLQIRWPTITAGQNVRITQEGCRYAVGPSFQNVSAAGGRLMATVFGDPVTVSCAIGCPWTVESQAPWIHVTRTTGAGDDGLFYEVDVNTTGQVRTGTIRIERVFLTIQQSAQ